MMMMMMWMYVRTVPPSALSALSHHYNVRAACSAMCVPPGASVTSEPSDPGSKTGSSVSVCMFVCSVVGWCPYPQCPVPVPRSHLGAGAQDVTQPAVERQTDTDHHIHIPLNVLHWGPAASALGIQWVSWSFRLAGTHLVCLPRWVFGFLTGRAYDSVTDQSPGSGSPRCSICGCVICAQNAGAKLTATTPALTRLSDGCVCAVQWNRNRIA